MAQSPSHMKPAAAERDPADDPCLQELPLWQTLAYLLHTGGTECMWSWQTSPCQGNTVWAVGTRTGSMMNKLVLHAKKLRQLMYNSGGTSWSLVSLFSTEGVPGPLLGQCLILNQLHLCSWIFLTWKSGSRVAPGLWWTRKNKLLILEAGAGANMTQ